MKVLSNLTIKNLKLNKSRTIVTIIGIVLSTAMLVCLSTLVSSGLRTLEAFCIENSGDYHVTFYDVPTDEVSSIALHQQTQKYYIEQYRSDLTSEFKDSYDQMPAQIVAFDENALEENKSLLTDGRLPQNENEVLLGTDAMFKDVAIGDKITLSNNKSYTVVGKISGTKMVFTVAPIILYMSEPTGETTISIKLKNPSEFQETIKSIIGENHKYEYNINKELLAYQTWQVGDDMKKTVLGASIIAAFIIILTSVFCIRNSFAISINEKVRQYGMLASVGTTNRQIRRNVLFESAILGLISIPIGVIGGILAAFILIKVSSVYLATTIDQMGDFKFHIMPWIIAFAVLLACVTIFFSSIGSAVKAGRISEIEAIKNTNEIKVTRRSTKVPKLIKKLFGIGGVFAFKNLKRNRKKFTTTTIALVVSIVTFISLSYYMDLGFEMSKTVYSDLGYNIQVNGSLADEVQQYAKDLDGIEKMGFIHSLPGYCEKLIESRDSNEQINFVTFDDESYQDLLKENSIEYDEDTFVVYDRVTTIEDGKIVYVNLFDNLAQKGMLNAFVGLEGDMENKKQVKLNFVTSKIKPKTLMNDLVYVICSQTQYEKYIYTTEEIAAYEDTTLYINSEDPYETEKLLKEFTQQQGINVNIANAEKIEKTTQSMMTLISIFAYGFISVIILIGLTNIYNSLATNLKLRKKEFAMLQSIGMTNKEFNKMIRFESICYVSKSLFIGVPIGILVTLLMNYLTNQGAMTYAYHFPLIQIVSCTVVVFLVVYGIMKSSLNKIAKQNVIETIRQENV